MKLTKEDKLWAKEVKERDNNRCVICGKEERLNAHHLFPREIELMKHDINNGISLCPLHHRFSREISPHQNPIAFHIWMLEHRPFQLERIINKWERLEKNGM